MFSHFPCVLVKYMVSKYTKKLDYFPARHRVFTYFSPRLILHKEILDYERHCKCVLGEYVQEYEDDNPKNNNTTSFLDCLYLRATWDHQGAMSYYICKQIEPFQEIRLLTFQLLRQSLNKYIHWKNLIKAKRSKNPN